MQRINLVVVCGINLINRGRDRTGYVSTIKNQTGNHDLRITELVADKARQWLISIFIFDIASRSGFVNQPCAG